MVGDGATGENDGRLNGNAAEEEWGSGKETRAPGWGVANKGLDEECVGACCGVPDLCPAAIFFREAKCTESKAENDNN